MIWERGRALSSSSSSRVSGGSARKIFGKSGIGDRRRAGARGGQRKQNKHTLTRHSGGRFSGR